MRHGSDLVHAHLPVHGHPGNRGVDGPLHDGLDCLPRSKRYGT